MTQWGSKALGDQGYTAIEILRHFYGDSIFIIQQQRYPVFLLPGPEPT